MSGPLGACFANFSKKRNLRRKDCWYYSEDDLFLVNVGFNVAFNVSPEADFYMSSLYDIYTLCVCDVV